MDGSPSGSSVHGSLQARILEWVAIPSFKGSSRPRNQTCISLASCIAGGFFTTEPPWVWRGCNKTPHPLIYGHPLGQLVCILMGVHLIYRERSCRYPESSLKICSLLGTRRTGRVLRQEHEPWKALDRIDGELLSSSGPLLVLHLGPYDV